MKEKPFSQRAHSRGIFNSTRAVIGEDRIYVKRTVSQRMISKAEHDKPFKPSHPPRIGYNKTIDKFPEYKEEGVKEITKRREADPDAAPIPKFKPTHNYKTRPTPSVAVNIRNLKSAFPSVFRR